MLLAHGDLWPLVSVLALAVAPGSRMDARDEVLRTAAAHWRIGQESPQWSPPLDRHGRVEAGVEAEGPGAIRGAKVARLADGWLDAGKSLGVSGSGVTVYLRARDPRGLWTYALLAKRGGHDVVNYNLFSVQLGGPTASVGFEVHTRRGFVMVSFPVTEIDTTAWHDLVGRYDGKSVDVICDGRIMSRKRWPGGDLSQNDEPTLIGAETDQGRTVRPFTGDMEEAAIWRRALTDAEVATMCRKQELENAAPLPGPYISPIHYRPDPGTLADPIPFFWKGEYHVFYLLAGMGGTPWAHIVSRDLIHWKELPIALPLGKPGEPDGGNVFTGSVIESAGAFHIYYTGFNPGHPGGREQIMHATSPDLIHWTKHPAETFGADGIHYQNNRGEDFRDAFVFRNEAERDYWMLLCARDARTAAPVTGVAASSDLTHWSQLPPLVMNYPGTPECPDLFQIGRTCYLIVSPSVGSTIYRSANELRGVWTETEACAVDSPILYAAKSMFDGRRRILVGWIRDLGGERDGGSFEWGGHLCVPREVYSVRPGELRFRPVPEAVAIYARTVADLADRPKVRGNWTYDDRALRGSAGSTCRFGAPENYLLDCRLEMDPAATVTLSFRQQQAADSGYRLTLRPAISEVEIAGPGFHFPRRCPIDASKPIHIQAFVDGTIIECFVNDSYAFSCRAYDVRIGDLGFAVSSGSGNVASLSIRTVPAADNRD